MDSGCDTREPVQDASGSDSMRDVSSRRQGCAETQEDDCRHQRQSSSSGYMASTSRDAFGTGATGRKSTRRVRFANESWSDTGHIVQHCPVDDEYDDSYAATSDERRADCDRRSNSGGTSSSCGIHVYTKYREHADSGIHDDHRKQRKYGHKPRGAGASCDGSGRKPRRRFVSSASLTTSAPQHARRKRCGLMSAQLVVSRSLPLMLLAMSLFAFTMVSLFNISGKLSTNGASLSANAAGVNDPLWPLPSFESRHHRRSLQTSTTTGQRRGPGASTRPPWSLVIFASAEPMNDGERQSKQDAFEDDLETTLIIESRDVDAPTDDVGEYDCTFSELYDTTSSKQCKYAKTFATTTTTTLTAQGIRPDEELGRFFMTPFGVSAIDTINLKYYTFVPNVMPFNATVEMDDMLITPSTSPPPLAGTLRKIDIRTGEQVSIGGSLDVPFPYTPVAMTYDLLAETLLMLVNDYETDYDVPGVLTLIAVDVDTGELKMDDSDIDGEASRYAGGTFVSFCKSCDGSPNALSNGSVAELAYDYTSSILPGYMAFDTSDQTVFMVLVDPDHPDESMTLFAVRRPRNVDVQEYEVSVDWTKFRNYAWPTSCSSISKLEYIPRDVRSETLEAGAVLYFPTGKPKSIGAIVNINDHESPENICSGLPCGAQISDRAYAAFLASGYYDTKRLDPIVLVDGRAHCKCESAAIRVHIDMEANYTQIARNDTTGLMLLGNDYWDGTDAAFSIMRYLDSKDANRTSNDNDVASVQDASFAMSISTVKASTGTEGAEVFGADFHADREDLQIYSIGYQGQQQSATDCSTDDSCLSAPDVAILGALERENGFPVLLQHDRDFSKTVEYKITLLKDLPTVATKSYADNLNGIRAGETVCTVKPSLTCANCELDTVSTVELSLSDADADAADATGGGANAQTMTMTHAEYFEAYGRCPVPCDEYDCSKNECMVYAGTPCGAVVSAGTEVLLDIKAFTVFGLPPKSQNDNFTITVAEVLEDEAGVVMNANILGLPSGRIMLGPVFRDLGEDGTLPGGVDDVLSQVTADSVHDPSVGLAYPNVMDLSFNTTTGSLVDGCRDTDDGSNLCARYVVRPWFTGVRGTYRTKFAVDKAGAYEITLTDRGLLTYEEEEYKSIFHYLPQATPLLGANLAGAPYNLTIVPAEPVGALSVLSGTGVVEATVGNVESFLIAMFDRFGNRITDDRQPVIEVNLLGAGESVQCFSTSTTVDADAAAATMEDAATAAWCDIAYDGDGYYKTRYYLVSRSKLEPFYDMTVSVGGISVINPEVSSSFAGGGGDDDEEKDPRVFVIQVRNSVSSAAMSFSIAPVGAADGRVSADVGVEASFGVQARDKFGNLQDMSESSGNAFSVRVTDAIGSTVTASTNATAFPSATEDAHAASEDFLPPIVDIEDLNNGQYIVRYTVYKSGTCSVLVMFNDEVIGTATDVQEGSRPPHEVEVKPGAIRAAMSLAVGDGVQSSGVVAGEESEFEIIFRDDYGNEVQDQGASSVFGAQSARHTLITECEGGLYPCDEVITREYAGMTVIEVPNTDLGLFDGEVVGAMNGYTASFISATQQLFVSYTLPLAGLYDFEISLTEAEDAGGVSIEGASEYVAIDGSPYHMRVAPGAVSYLYCELFFIEEPTAVAEDGVTIVSLDPVFHSSLQRATHTFTTITNGDASTAITAKPDVGESFVMSARAGTNTNTFYIQTRDEFGNLITNIDGFEDGANDTSRQATSVPSVVVTGPKGYGIYAVGEDDEEDAPKVAYVGQGAFEVTYGPRYTGKHTAAITMDNLEIRQLRFDEDSGSLVYGDRFTIDVRPQAPSAAASSAGAPGAGLIGGIFNQELSFTLYAKDPNGNLELDSSALTASSFSVRFRDCGIPTSSTLSAEFKDGCRSNAFVDLDEEAGDQRKIEMGSILPEQNGFYTATYTPLVASVYKLELLFDDEQMLSFAEEDEHLGLDDVFIKVKTEASMPVVNATRLISIDASDGLYAGGTAGDAQTAYLQAHDEDGLPVGFIPFQNMVNSVGPINVDASNIKLVHATDADTQVVATSATHRGQSGSDDAAYGTYAVGFAEGSVTMSGDYTLDVRVSEINSGGASQPEEIADNGRTITILPAATDANSVQVTLEGSDDAALISSVSRVANETFSLTIKTFDVHGNEQMYMHPSLIDMITVVFEEAVTLTRTSYPTTITAVQETLPLSGLPYYRVTYSVSISSTVATTLNGNAGGSEQPHRVYVYMSDASTNEMVSISNRGSFTSTDSATNEEESSSISGVGTTTASSSSSASYYLPFNVVPADVHVPNCLAQLTNTEFVVGDEVGFTIMEYDIFGNRRSDLSASREFDVEVVFDSVDETEGIMASTEIVPYTLNANGGTDVLHSVRFLAGFRESDANSFVSGQYNITIGSVDETTDTFVAIANSGKRINVDAGALSLDTSVVYGQGIVYDHLERGKPGTNRVGYDNTIVIEGRDAFGNRKQSGGDVFTLALTPMGTEKGMSTTSTDYANGTYVIAYQPSVTGSFALTVERDGAYFSLNRYFFSSVCEDASSAPCATSDLKNVFTEEADGRIVKADAAGVATGVLTSFLPGPLSSTYSYATGDVIGKSGTAVTVDAQTALSFTLVALDVQNSNKVDDDNDRVIRVTLEYVSDKNGETDDLKDPSTERLAYYAGPGSEGTSAFFAEVALNRSASEPHLYTVSDPFMYAPETAGTYKLWCNVTYVDEVVTNEDGTQTLLGDVTGTEVMGSGETLGPYVIVVKAAESSGEDSGLSGFGGGGGGGSRRQGRRRALASSDDDGGASSMAAYGMIEVAAGERLEGGISLSDKFNNEQDFDELRRLDIIELKIGEETFENHTACVWDTSSVPPSIDIAASDADCTAVHTGIAAAFNRSISYEDPAAAPDGVGLAVSSRNNYENGTFGFSFSPDAQLPALSDHYYRLSIIMNDAPIAGTPLRLKVSSGPTSGRHSDLDRDDFNRVQSTSVVGVASRFTLNARDRFLNMQTNGVDESALFHVMLKLEEPYAEINGGGGTTGTAGTVGQLRRGAIGCTNHAGCAHCDECDFEVFVTPKATTTSVGDDDDGFHDHRGQYDVVFTPTVASSPGNPYTVSISFCPHGIEACTEKDQVFNHQHIQSSDGSEEGHDDDDNGGGDEQDDHYPPLALHVSPSFAVLERSRLRGHAVATGVALTSASAPAAYRLEFVSMDAFGNPVPRLLDDMTTGWMSHHDDWLVYGAEAASLYGAPSSLYGVPAWDAQGHDYNFTMSSPSGAIRWLASAYDAHAMITYLMASFTEPGTHTISVTDAFGSAPLTATVDAVVEDGTLSVSDSLVVRVDGSGRASSSIRTTAGERLVVPVQAFSCEHGYETGHAQCHERLTGGDVFRASLVGPTVSGANGNGDAAASTMTAPVVVRKIDAVDGALVNPYGLVPGMYGIVIEAYMVMTSGRYNLRIEGCAVRRDGDSDDEEGDEECTRDADFKPIKRRSIPVDVVPGVPSTTKSTVSFLDSDSWRAGDMLSAELVFKDEFNNLVEEPEGIFKRHPVRISLAGPTAMPLEEVFPASCTVADLTAALELGTYALCRNGNAYSIKFRVKQATVFSLEVMLYDEYLTGSFLIHLTQPNVVYPPNCIVTSGVRSIDAGSEEYIEVRLRDAFDNLVFSSPTNLNYFKVTYEMVDSFDTASEAGVGDNPLRLSGNTDVRLEYTSGASSSSSASDYAYGESSWSFRETGSIVKLYIWLQDIRDGTLYVTINSMRAGSSVLRITARDSLSEETSICATDAARALCEREMRLATSATPATTAFEVTVNTGAPDATESYAYSNSKALQVTTAAVDSELRIVAYDRYRNLISSDGFGFTVLLRSIATGEVLTGAAEYTAVPDVNAPSYYRASYEARTSGSYDLHILRKGSSILGRLTDDSGVPTVTRGPFPIEVLAGATYGPRVLVEHAFELRNVTAPGTSALTAASTVMQRQQLVAESGRVVRFTVTSFDYYGNRKTSGGDKYSVLIDGSIEGQVLDRGDGTYEVSYTLYNAGMSTMVISVNKATVSSPPASFSDELGGFPIEVGPSVTHADSCTASGKRLTATTAGVNSGFTIALRDQFANLQTKREDKVLAIITRNFDGSEDEEGGAPTPASQTDEDAGTDGGSDNSGVNLSEAVEDRKRMMLRSRRALLQQQQGADGDSLYGFPVVQEPAANTDNNVTLMDGAANVTELSVSYVLEVEDATGAFTSNITAITMEYINILTSQNDSGVSNRDAYLDDMRLRTLSYTQAVSDVTDAFVTHAAELDSNLTASSIVNMTSSYVDDLLSRDAAFAATMSDVAMSALDANATGTSYLSTMSDISSAFVLSLTEELEALVNSTTTSIYRSDKYYDLSGLSSYANVSFTSTSTGYAIGSYRILKQGLYSMLITVNDELIFNTTTLSVSPGAVGTSSRVDLAALGRVEVLTPRSFYVYPLDDFGNHVLTGATKPTSIKDDVISVEMYARTGRDRSDFTKVRLTDVTTSLVPCPNDENGGDGVSSDRWCWRTDFTSPVAGELLVYVSIDDELTLSSPGRLRVSPSTELGTATNCLAAADLVCSSVEGRGLEGISTDASVSSDLVIVARDINGYVMAPELDAGTDEDVGYSFRVTFRSPEGNTFSSPDDVDVKYVGGGAYDVAPISLPFDGPGEYELTVTAVFANGTEAPITSIDGDSSSGPKIALIDVSAAEYETYAAAIGETDALATEAGGEGLTVSIVGKTSSFTLSTRFNATAAATTVSGANGDGSGRRSLQGSNDSNGGFMHVRRGGSTVLLSMMRRTVGNSETNSTLGALEDDSQALTYNVTDNGDGTYQVSYAIADVARPGGFVLNATVNGWPIRRDGFEGTLYAGDVPDGNLTTVISSLALSANANANSTDGATADAIEGTAGSLVSMTITPKDAYGNEIAVYPWQLRSEVALRASAVFSGSSAVSAPASASVVGSPSTLTEEESLLLTASEKVTYTEADNTYRFSYRPTRSGVYTTSISMAGVPLLKVPPVTIGAGPVSGASSELYGIVDGIVVTDVEAAEAASAYEPLYLYVRLFDRYGNRIRRGTEGHLIQATAVNAEANVEASTTSAESVNSLLHGGGIDSLLLSDGDYRLNVTLPVTGTYAFSVRVNGELVKEFGDSTHTFTASVTRVAVSPGNCEVLREAAARMTLAEKPNYFQVQARDRDGIIKTGARPGEDEVTARFTPLNETNSFGLAMRAYDAIVTEDGDTGVYTLSYELVETGNYTLDIRVNGEEVPGVHTSEAFQVLPRFSPVQTDATMSETVTQLTIDFEDQEGNAYATDRGGLVGLDDCSKILAEDTLGYLGDGPKCTFSRADRLVIFLGFAASVLPNDLITFRPDTIYSVNKNSKSVVGSSKVIRPPIAPSPKLVLRAPVKLGVCEDLVLDTSGSYGTAGRVLNYEYGMYPNVPNEKVISGILHDATQSNLDRIVISNSLLYADVPYVFNVRVRNFLGETMSMQHTVTRRDFSVPQIMIEGENVIRTNVHKPLYVMASVKLPSVSITPTEGSDQNDRLLSACTVPHPEMDFTWTLDPVLSTDEFVLDARTEHSRTLYVAPYSMRAGHMYTLSIHGEIDGRPELSNEATAYVLAEYSPIQAKVKAPSTIKLGQSTPLVLNATTSVDPDDPFKLARDEFGPFEFRWACSRVDTQGSCFDDDSFLYQSSVVPSLIIGEEKLVPGEYEFAISVRKEPLYDALGPIAGRQVTLVKRIIVEEATAASNGTHQSSVSAVNIIPLNSTLVNSNEKLVLETELSDPTAKHRTSYHWSVLEGALDLDAYPTLIATPRNGSHLSIRANSLGGGSSYRLRVTATDRVSSLRSFDEVSFSVNNPPSSGSFSVEPADGYAASTTYALSCNNWEDDSGEPVMYEFRYLDPRNGDEVPLRSLTKDNKIETVLPPVSRHEDEHKMTLIAYVMDGNRAKVRVTHEVIAYPPQYRDASAVLMHMGANVTASGAAAFNSGLIASELRYANGTNDVASLITVATSILYINSEERERMMNAVVPLTDDELRDAEIARTQLAHVMSVLKRAVSSVVVSREEMDAFGVVYRAASANADDDDEDAKKGALNAVAELTGSALGQGIDGVASQSLLDSVGSVVAKSQGGAAAGGGASSGAAVASTRLARRLLLQASATGSEQVTSAASGGIDEETSAQVQDVVGKLATAGLKEHVAGEDAFAVATDGIQMAAARRSAADTAGGVLAPTGPNMTDAQRTAFTLPDDVLGGDGGETGEASVDLVLTTSQTNPFAYAHDGTRIQSDVSSFDIRSRGELEPRNVSGIPTPISIHIPISGSGGRSSSCRITQGGCRYFNEETREWSTDGMLERRRTATFIECETVHLSSFGLSSDDVMPEVVIVNPINAADLFSNLSVDNMLALFVVGALLALFAGANVVGYRLDVRDRANEKIKQRVRFLNYRLSEAKESATGLKSQRRSRKSSRMGHRGAREEIEYAEQCGLAIKNNHVLANVIFVKPNDPYTRPQRLTVLLVVVLGNICVAAIFFNAEPGNVMAKLYVGAMTAVILFPTKIVFKILFKSSVVTKKTMKQSRRPERVKALREQRMARLQRIHEDDERIRLEQRHKEEEQAARKAAGPAVALAQTSQHPGDHVEDEANVVLEMTDEPTATTPVMVHGRRTRGRVDGRLALPSAPLPPSSQSPTPRALQQGGGGLSVALGKVEPPSSQEVLLKRPKRSSTTRRHALMQQQQQQQQLGASTSLSGALPMTPPSPSSPFPNAEVGQLVIETAAMQPPSPARELQTASSLPRRPNVRRTRADLIAIIAAGAISQGRGNGPPAAGASTDGTSGEMKPPPPPPAPTASSAAMSAPAPPSSSSDASEAPRPPRAPRRRASLSSRSVIVPVTTSPVASYIKGTTPAVIATSSRRASQLGPSGDVAATPLSTTSTTTGMGSETAMSAFVSKRSVRDIIMQQEQELDAVASGRSGPLSQVVSVPGLAMAPETRDVVPEEVLRAVLVLQRAFRKKKARREAGFDSAAVRIQRHWRGFAARRRMMTMQQSSSRPQSAASASSSSKLGEGTGLWWVNAQRNPNGAAKPGSSRSSMWRASAGSRLTLSEASYFASLMEQRRSEQAEERALAAVHRGSSQLRTRRRRHKDKRGGKSRRNKQKGLPRWCIYLVYAGAFLFCMVASLMIVLYGLTFEPSIGRAWLLSSMLGITVEFFVQDPLRVCVLARVTGRFKYGDV